MVMREVGNGSNMCWQCSRMLEVNEIVAGQCNYSGGHQSLLNLLLLVCGTVISHCPGCWYPQVAGHQSLRDEHQ